MAKASRVVINRRAAAELELGLADGFFDMGVAILMTAQQEVPDLPPLTRGLVEGGGVLAYAGTKKVAGTTIGGRQIKKGRQMRTKAGIASVFVGFGFPGRLVHNGSVHNTADPFLARALFQELPDLERIVGPAVAKRMGGPG